ncbi:MAG: ferrochelatase, partial [Staphylococcus aureus]|nr:ferrochelatase [Staphylococcus aureus]
AHSLPKGLIEKNNDPYPQELEHTALLIKEQSNIEHIAIGWQSEGNTGTPWLGPDVQDLTRDLYEKHQYKNFIYTPVGFVCEHLEVLYDNDYECKVVCDDIGANYYRPKMPNTHPLFIGAIVDEIKSIF